MHYMLHYILLHPAPTHYMLDYMLDYMLLHPAQYHYMLDYMLNYMLNYMPLHPAQYHDMLHYTRKTCSITCFITYSTKYHYMHCMELNFLSP
jgi:hypothetical protein